METAYAELAKAYSELVHENRMLTAQLQKFSERLELVGELCPDQKAHYSSPAKGGGLADLI